MKRELVQLEKYDNFIFDCDGVLLNSNTIKTEAFESTLSEFDPKIVAEFLEYHRQNGGVSRLKKLRYFCETLLTEDFEPCLVDRLSALYGRNVYHGLLTADVVSILPILRAVTIDRPWFVISGGQENELRDIFRNRGLCSFFDGGIYGNPRTKNEIFKVLLSENMINGNSIFFGDSKYDFEVANEFEIDFVFVYGWTEMRGWSSYCKKHGIKSIYSLDDLIVRNPA